MAGLRKDVDLIFRGEDRVSPSIKGIRSNVEGLTRAIAEQSAAADRGEGSIDELAKSYRSLKDAQGDVNEIVKIALAFEKQTAALEKTSAAVAEAKAKQDAANVAYDNAAKKTKTLANARETAANRVAGLIAKEDELRNTVRELGAALDAAGGDSKDFAATQERIQQAAKETARALRDAAAASDEFKGKQAAGQANIKSQKEMGAFNEMAAGSGLPQAQIAFIATLENKMEALGAAIKADTASFAAFNREVADQSTALAADRALGLARALDEADASAARLKATAGFRAFAAEIEAGAREVGRFGVVADSAAISGQRFADTIQAILAPTQAAVGDLEGINGVIGRSEAVLEGAKRRMSEYNAEVNNLQAAMTGLQSIAGTIDDFQRQEAAVAGATAEFQRAQGEVLQLAAAIRTADEPTKEMANALSVAEANLEKAGAAMQRESTKLAALDAKLKAAKIDTHNLAGAQDELTAAANRAAAAQQKVTAKTGGKGSFLGLNPNEMQNLGFQINDVVVSLISGQKPLTVLVQQGAQIGQIIPGAFSSIVRFAPQLLALAAVVAVLGGAFKKAADEARLLKLGEGITTQMGAGVSTTAAEFADLGAQLEKAGVEADKTRGILVDLATTGLSTAEMEQYIATAKNVAEVTGVEVADALKTMQEAFGGGLDEIIALDDATNVYTDDQIALIAQLFEQGRAEEARTMATKIYQDKMNEVAEQQRGPWANAAIQLGNAWNNFLTAVSNLRPIRTAIYILNELGKAAAYASARLAGKSVAEATAIAAQGSGPPRKGSLDEIRSRPLSADAPGQKPRRTNAGNQQAREDALALRTARATTREQRAALVVEKARLDAAGKRLTNIEIQEHAASALAQFNATEDKKDAKRDAAAGKRKDAAARRAAAAAKAAARRAEAEQNKIERAEETLARSLEQLDAKVARNSTTSIEEKLSAIDSEYAKLFRSIDDYSKQTGGKGKIGGRTITEAREHVKIQLDTLKNYTKMEDFEKGIGDLEKERKEKLDGIADQVARGIISPEDGLVQSNAVIDDMAAKINAMAAAALTFAATLSGAKLTPELSKLIAGFQTAAQNNSGGQNTRAKQDVAKTAIDAGEQKLNDIISARNTLIQTENTLVEMGLQSRKQAEQNIAAAFGDSKKAILDQIDAIRRLAAAYGTNLTPEMALYFKNLEANLKLAAVQTDYTSQSFTNLRAHINELLTSQIVGFIDSVAQAFARVVTGQEDVLGFLAAVGRAFLTMIANILQTVATLILEALILSAVDKATGGILKPLLQLTASAASIRHEGGVVQGGGNRTRQVSPLAFANAPRYHSGGIAGFAPNEIPAVLKRNEEVLTENDPRHRNNGGLSPAGPAGGATGIRQVLAIGDDEIAGAMAGAAGEKTVLTHIRRNKASLKQMFDQ